MNGVGVDFIQLRRRPARDDGDFARCRAFLRSRGLSSADAATAVEIGRNLLCLPDQKISVTGVFSYRGDELSCTESRLDPERTYRVLRPAETLRRAAEIGISDGKLLDRHVPDFDVLTDDEIRGSCVGRFSGLTFDGRFLRAARVIVTRADAIAAILNKTKRAWSLGAAVYELAMTPGEHDGEAYDGIMAGIEVTHVALVGESRAGQATKITFP